MASRGETIEAVELGHILEVEIDGEIQVFPKKTPLYWLPKLRALFWSTFRPKKRRSATASRAQISMFERWHAHEPRKGARLETYPDPKPSAWREVGGLDRIDYHSKKWGDDQEYTHETTGRTMVYRAGSIWVAHGAIKLSRRGLIR